MTTHAPARSRYFLDAHHCFFIELGIALLFFFFFIGHIPFWPRIIVAWDAFALTGIILTWITILRHDPYEIRQRILLSERTRKFLFITVILAAIASFLATWLLLTSHSTGTLLQWRIVLGILTVALSWFLVHTRFAMQYAYRYYAEAAKKERSEIPQGLLFPGKNIPDYLDFTYFSFVIGMTSQVSDVQVVDRHLRRLVLLHGLISFYFNTSIVALIVNIVGGWLS